MNVLERFWKTVSSNPMAALGTLGLGAGLVGAFAPETSKYITNYLDMTPEKSLTTKNLYGKSNTYGQGNKFLGTVSTGGVTVGKKPSFLGMDSGLLYDIRKGIGKTLSTPFKLGEMFNSNGAAYKYLLGKEGSSWANVKDSFRNALPFSKTGEEMSEIKKMLLERAISGGGSGGGGGGGGGSGTGFRRGARTASTYAPGNFSSTKTKGYNPYGLSANLLARAYRDENLGWVNRQSQRQSRIGPNIGIKEANISVKNRFTRVR